MTEVIRVDSANPDPRAIERAAACLRRGGLVAFPTETVYGLGVHALDREAVLRLFRVKERPANDPLIVHVSTIDDVAPLVAELPSCAYALAARFWGHRSSATNRPVSILSAMTNSRIGQGPIFSWAQAAGRFSTRTIDSSA